MPLLPSLSAWRARLVGPLQGRVLEIGVGRGENLAHYRSASLVAGIEPHPERAAAAQAAARRASQALGVPMQVSIAPAEALPFPQDAFDAVVSSLVFCSVDEPEAALGEIERVLRPDGALWMVEHIRPQAPVLAHLTDVATPAWRRIAYNCHLNRPTLDVLRARGWRVQVFSRRGVFVKLRAQR
ncbi:MAG: SAM-dependent methyltransferase [Caldilineae bacterium]|nr:MAG: SAM-dependent methyltransferase [Caldilineae bacterium]